MCDADALKQGRGWMNRMPRASFRRIGRLFRQRLNSQACYRVFESLVMKRWEENDNIDHRRLESIALQVSQISCFQVSDTCGVLRENERIEDHIFEASVLLPLTEFDFSIYSNSTDLKESSFLLWMLLWAWLIKGNTIISECSGEYAGII